jgi:hypothetical protein
MSLRPSFVAEFLAYSRRPESHNSDISPRMIASTDENLTAPNYLACHLLGSTVDISAICHHSGLLEAATLLLNHLQAFPDDDQRFRHLLSL